MIHGSVTYRIITDNHGSVRLVVNAETGEVAQRLDYDSFGRVLRDTNPGFQPFGFQGGLYDPDTGLVEFGCRWYDAYTGRWISKDPIILDGGWNVYAFCDNDPINRTDPSGMYWFWQFKEFVPVIGVISSIAPAVAAGIAVAVTVAIAAELVTYCAKKLSDTASYFNPKGGHNIRPSSKPKHEEGNARRLRDQERSRRLNGGRSIVFPIDDQDGIDVFK